MAADGRLQSRGEEEAAGSGRDCVWGGEAHLPRTVRWLSEIY